MLPTKQAIKRHVTVPPQITCASALPCKMGKHENHIFSLKCSNRCIARIQLVTPWFLQSF